MFQLTKQERTLLVSWIIESELEIDSRQHRGAIAESLAIMTDEEIVDEAEALMPDCFTKLAEITGDLIIAA